MPALPGLVALALLTHLAAPARDPTRELVVVLSPSVPSARAESMARVADRLRALGLSAARTLGDVLPPARITVPPGFGGLDPGRVLLVRAGDSAAAEAALGRLATTPGVEWAEPNRIREPAHASFPDDPLYVDTRHWGLRNLGPAGAHGGRAGADIDAPNAWALSVGGPGVWLALADTGVDPSHPELAAWLADGVPRIAHGIDLTAPGGAFADLFGHGTPVAGVMAARSGEGVHFDSLGVAGVCGGDGALNPGCRLIPIKVTPGHTGSATSFDLAAAILYAARLGARAVNVSFAGSGPSRLERLAMHEALLHGCVTVAASGNRGFSDGRAPQYPAAYAADGLGIQVGASDPFDERAVFSSYGPGLDVVAPGVDVWSTFMTYPSAAGASYPGYVRVSGTSYAAPFATGTIGLLAAARPGLADTDLQQLLRLTAADVGPAGPDSLTGWGRLDAARALTAVRGDAGLWHDEVAASIVRPAGWDSLRVHEPGSGYTDRWAIPVWAERFELLATVALPDSFADSVLVWPRIGGTTSVRGGFRLPYLVPWCGVVDRATRTFTLRGYAYRVAPEACPDCEPADREVPLPLDQMRFGFTVLGPLRRPGSIEKPALAPRLAASPNPFRRTTRIAALGVRGVDVFDTGGRRVRRLASDREGMCAWDGRDAAGHLVAPGLYLARPIGGRAAALKLIRLR